MTPEFVGSWTIPFLVYHAVNALEVPEVGTLELSVLGKVREGFFTVLL